MLDFKRLQRPGLIPAQAAEGDDGANVMASRCQAGNFGGMAGPVLYGWLLDAGQPMLVFFAAAAFMLLTAMMALAQEWRLRRRRRLAAAAPAE